jgi:ADP-ribose pyrophosphatase YjhB (NUDIX family)
MYSTTLCFLIRKNEILLGMKKTGFGQGKYNGFGGKIKEGESVLQATVRELEEESGIQVEEVQLEHVGILDFIFPASPQLRHDVHIFLARAWRGEPLETEEMKPQWFLHSAIPYDQMWQDDIFWLPKVLTGKRIKGTVVFAENNEDLCEINLS